MPQNVRPLIKTHIHVYTRIYDIDTYIYVRIYTYINTCMVNIMCAYIPYM